jgi:hypothetical protein
MTALNFPDSPSNGDTYQGYTYNSTKSAWAKPDSPDPDARTAVYANIAALPTSGTAGDMAYVTATNRLYLWTGTGWYNIALINNNPTISGVNSSYTLAVDGTATTVTITATDPEGLPITYSLVSDTSGNSATVAQGTGSNTNVFTITPSTNSADAGSFSLTFRASDGVNIASSAASFTLQFQVQNSNYTTALITSVGANLADNNDFVDSSTNSHTITAAGNVTQTTFSPYRHGGYSTYFDGTAGTKLTTPAQFDFSGVFTAEFWFHIQTGKRIEIGTEKDVTPSDFDYWRLGTNGSGYPFFQCRSDSVTVTTATGSTLVNDGAWHHIVGVRDASGNMTLYVDGVSAATATNNGNLGTSQTINIGAFDYESTGNDAWGTGYLRDVRVSSNVRYSANFSVPTEALTADSNTTLLTCHLPYIADGSTNGHAITVNGNAKPEPFAPYDEYEYAAADHGGSMYFDGSGDYLSATYDVGFNMGDTTDFTMEAWVYQINQTGNHTIFAQYAGTGTAHSDVNGHRWIFWIDDGQVQLYQYPDMTTQLKDSGTLKLNTWNHVAATREGSVFRLFVNGIQVSTVTSSTIEVGFLNDPLTVGYYNSTGYFNGIISDVRLVKGTAVYTSAFTPPTAPLTAITNTQLLLSGTNAGIIDKAQSVKTITLNGDVKSSTTQTKYLTSSMYFDGTGDRIQLPQTSLNLSNADFTVEAWVYTTATSQQTIVGSLVYSNGTGSWLLTVNYNSNKVRFFMRHGGGTVQDAQFEAGTFPTNAWTHVAVTRDGSNIRAFINGTQAGTTNTALGTNAIDNALTNYYIGDNQDGNTYWNGYMSDVRITKGLARYTSNFTAPTAALQG